LEARILSGASGVRRLASCVVGVGDAARTRKVVVQHQPQRPR
jgi:hypothetical protein